MMQPEAKASLTVETTISKQKDAREVVNSLVLLDASQLLNCKTSSVDAVSILCFTFNACSFGIAKKNKFVIQAASFGCCPVFPRHSSTHHPGVDELTSGSGSFRPS